MGTTRRGQIGDDSTHFNLKISKKLDKTESVTYQERRTVYRGNNARQVYPGASGMRTGYSSDIFRSLGHSLLPSEPEHMLPLDRQS